MAKEFSNSFYKTKLWQDCRNSYAKQRGYLCELCLSQGMITPGEIVHHKIELTPENINDPNITLSFSNLQLLCREHHAMMHKKSTKNNRYLVDEQGRVVGKPE